MCKRLEECDSNTAGTIFPLLIGTHRQQDSVLTACVVLLAGRTGPRLMSFHLALSQLKNSPIALHLKVIFLNINLYQYGVEKIVLRRKEAAMADKDKGEKTIGELVSELAGEVRELLRQELDLFTTEMKDKLVALAKDAAAIGAGGVLLYTGFLVLLAAIVLGLATVMPAWGGALVVAIGLIAIGAVLVLKGGKDVKEMDAKPEETVGALKETVQWAKTLKLTSSRRRGFASKSGTRKAI